MSQIHNGISFRTSKDLCMLFHQPLFFGPLSQMILLNSIYFSTRCLIVVQTLEGTHRGSRSYVTRHSHKLSLIRLCAIGEVQQLARYHFHITLLCTLFVMVIPQKHTLRIMCYWAVYHSEHFQIRSTSVPGMWVF